MTKREAKRLAAFMMEYMKQGKDACTVVLTRELIMSIYEIAKEKEYERETESEVGGSPDR